MQKLNRGNIPKRTRFYQSLIDAPLLKSGEKSFDHLNPSYIVVICDFDLYNQGKYRYTFSNQCKEIPGMELGDESIKIILNSKGTNDDQVDKSLIDFLHYVPDSTKNQLSETCDRRLHRLHEIIESIRSNSEMEATYMKGITREREIIEDAKAEGKIEESASSVLFFLAELGDIPDNIRIKIQTEQNLDILRKWLPIAAKAKSIQDFIRNIEQ